MVPLQHGITEATTGRSQHPSYLPGGSLPGYLPVSSQVSPQGEVAWGSPRCPEDLYLLCQWLLEHWWLLGHHQLMEQLILSIFSSWIVAGTRANWWASLMRAIISSYKISVYSSKLLIHAAVHGSKFHTRIRPRGIGWQLLLLCRWPL